MDDDVLTGYLQNHWVGATAGVSLFQRVARTHGDPDTAAAVAELADEIAAERETLRALIRALGAEPTRIGALAAKAGAELGRLKPNGHIVTRSPLTDVLEIEALRDAVYGKRSGWQALRSAADHDPRLDAAMFDHLMERADDQLVRLATLHVDIARKRIAAA